MQLVQRGAQMVELDGLIGVFGGVENAVEDRHRLLSKGDTSKLGGRTIAARGSAYRRRQVFRQHPPRVSRECDVGRGRDRLPCLLGELPVGETCWG